MRLDIFFTQTGQYLVSTDPATLAARFIASFSNKAYNGVLLPESGFRMGLPWPAFHTTPTEAHAAYLSGRFEQQLVEFPPPFPAESTAPVIAIHTLVEFRVRPNLFLVLLVYGISALFLADLLGLELFWKYHYYVWKVLLYLFSETLLVAGTFRGTEGLKRRFERIL